MGYVLKYITIHDKYVYPFRGVSDPFWRGIGTMPDQLRCRYWLLADYHPSWLFIPHVGCLPPCWLFTPIPFGGVPVLCPISCDVAIGCWLIIPLVGCLSPMLAVYPHVGFFTPRGGPPEVRSFPETCPNRHILVQTRWLTRFMAADQWRRAASTGAGPARRS